MRLDKVNDKRQDSTEKNVDITWKKLIDDSAREIEVCRDKISRLRKSIVFFSNQDAQGVPFPALGKEEVKRHENLS